MLEQNNSNILEYYATQSVITDPKKYGTLFEDLPDNVPDLCRVIQGIFIHYKEGELYNVKVNFDRRQEADLRYISAILAHIQELDARPLTIPRPAEKRVVGCCRDAALLLCAMLRYKDIPARVRFGFSAYFQLPDNFCADHVVCEYWQASEQRWILADPQQDELHCQLNQLAFNPYDIPRDQFITAGKAWQLARSNQVNPTCFGFNPKMSGLWVLRLYLVHELASLNKMELLIWDVWGLGDEKEENVKSGQLELLDQIATLTEAEANDDTLKKLQTIYENNADLQIPAVVKVWAVVARAESQVSIGSSW